MARQYRMTFDEIYKSHFETIYKVVFRLTVSHEETKDIAQETFMRLFKQLKSGRELQYPRAWLYKVALNLLSTGFRRNAKYREVMSDTLVGNFHNESAEDILIRREQRESVKVAMNNLPERDRMILVLYQERLSYSEIADILNINSNSVGKTLSRAIEKLASDPALEHVK